jgi:excisionase family DNA binding protein
MTEDAQGSHRHQLLGILFGSEVPEALEGQLLRTSDVATLFQVSERTVSEWAKRGQIPSVRTPGGHRRYPADGIRSLLQAVREGGGQADRTDRTATYASTASSDPAGNPWASATEG